MELGPTHLSSYAESADDSRACRRRACQLMSSAGVTKVTGSRRPAKVITKKRPVCSHCNTHA
jgi:hypothetical protein